MPPSPPRQLPEHHAKFLKWAESKGVSLNGVEPAVLQGSGVGIIAARDVKKDETIMHIPRSAMLTLTDPDRSLYAPDQPQLSIHGRLARRFLPSHMKNSKIEEKIESYVDDDLALWRGAMPSQEHVEDDMPLMWDERLQDQLPTRAKELLEKQQTKFNADLAAITEVEFENLDETSTAKGSTPSGESCREAFAHMWMLVNSRCFYWDYPDLEVLPPTSAPNRGGKKGKVRLKGTIKERDRDDCMALCPVIDYFNHGAVEDCTVSFSSTGYTVTALRSISVGSQIHVSYGQHSNDFLLVEYGFLLLGNPADFMILDTHILPLLSDSQKEALRDRNLLGQYTLDNQSICWRTQCAISALVLAEQRWHLFVDGNIALDESEIKRSEETCQKVLRAQADQCASVSVGAIVTKNPGVKTEAAKAALWTRWAQMRKMVDAELERRLLRRP